MEYHSQEVISQSRVFYSDGSHSYIVSTPQPFSSVVELLTSSSGFRQARLEAADFLEMWA